MGRYLARRLITAIPVIILVSMIAFSLILLLPGDPALAILGESLARDEERYQALKTQMGLDQPIPIQYIRWVGRAFSGDFGTSVRTGQPVAEAILQRLTPTLLLTFLSLIISIIVALPIGILSAMKPNSAMDAGGTLFALSGVAVPNFFLGILLIFVFSVWLRWLPPSGYVSPAVDLGESLKLMLMPSLALATGMAAVIMRQLRAVLIEVLQMDYIRTARSKGLWENRVVLRHALKNGLIPVVTLIGMQVGRLFGGTVTIELIFSIPGMGRLAVDSIFFRDFPVLQAIVMVMALAVLIFNLAADIFYAYLDPRIRFA